MSDGLDHFLLKAERIAVIVAALAALVPIAFYIIETSERRLERQLQKAQALDFCREEKIIPIIQPVLWDLDKNRDPNNTVDEDRKLILSRIEKTPLNEFLKICRESGYPEPDMIKALRQ
jgi:hypothetical protein